MDWKAPQFPNSFCFIFSPAPFFNPKFTAPPFKKALDFKIEHHTDFLFLSGFVLMSDEDCHAFHTGKVGEGF